MAAIDRAKNHVEILNSPNESSLPLIPESRRSPLLMNNSSFTIIPNLLDLDQEQLQKLFDKDDSKVKEEPLNEIEDKKVISSQLKSTLDSALKQATPAKVKVTKMVSILENSLNEKDIALQSLQSRYNAIEILMRSLAGDLVDQEELNKTLQQEMIISKKRIASLAHQNNRYHLQMSVCEYCSISPSMPLPPSPTLTPDQSIPIPSSQSS